MQADLIGRRTELDRQLPADVLEIAAFETRKTKLDEPILKHAQASAFLASWLRVTPQAEINRHSGMLDEERPAVARNSLHVGRRLDS